MEKELSGINWRNVRRLAAIGLVIALFAYFYVVVLVYASVHSKQGNVVLAVLIGFGALAVYASILGVNKHYDYVGKHHRFSPGRIAFLAIVILVLWHAAGAIVPNPEVQRIFVFTPVVLLGVAAVIGLSYLLNEGARINKQHQR